METKKSLANIGLIVGVLYILGLCYYEYGQSTSIEESEPSFVLLILNYLLPISMAICFVLFFSVNRWKLSSFFLLFAIAFEIIILGDVLMPDSFFRILSSTVNDIFYPTSPFGENTIPLWILISVCIIGFAYLQSRTKNKPFGEEKILDDIR